MLRSTMLFIHRLHHTSCRLYRHSLWCASYPLIQLMKNKQNNLKMKQSVVLVLLMNYDSKCYCILKFVTFTCESLNLQLFFYLTTSIRMGGWYAHLLLMDKERDNMYISCLFPFTFREELYYCMQGTWDDKTGNRSDGLVEVWRLMKR